MSFRIQSNTLLYSPITIRRKPPVNVDPEEERFFRHEYKRNLPEVFLYELSDVHVSPEGIVFNRFNVFTPSLIEESRKKNFGTKYLLSNYIRRKRLILPPNESYVLAFDEWTNGYFHWICDTLPRLEAISDKLHNWILLIPENYTSDYVIESLKIFKYKDIVRIPRDAYVKIKRLVLPMHIALSGNYNPKVLYSLKEKYLGHFNESSMNMGEKIYVSRKKANYRFILNEDEVISTVVKYGFRVIYFEDYNFRQQISIMRNANYLVGIIGANLVNMIFMKAGSSVLLFTTKNNEMDNCYFSLANAFNYGFYCQFCDYFDTRPGAFWNLHVDTDLLKNNLELMINKK